MSIVVYTVILNAWDYLRPPEVIDPGARYLAFVDQPLPPCPPWEQQPAYAPFESVARNSRLPKLLPHLHFDATYSVYHDANFALKRSPEYLIERYLRPKGREIAMFIHPARKTVEQEANEILKHPEWFPHVDMDAVRGQVTRWKHIGAPIGLWAAGMIIRKHTEDIAAFNLMWWQEFMRGCTRDQLALPIARHFAGTQIEDIDGNITGGNNDLMAFHWHAAWKDKEDNPARAAAYAEWKLRESPPLQPIDRERLAKLERVCESARCMA
jgi:hypothetical protein